MSNTPPSQEQTVPEIPLPQPEVLPSPNSETETLTSETSSTHPLTEEQKLDRLILLQTEAAAILSSLTPREIEKENDIRELADGDIMIRLHAEVLSKDGELFNVRSKSVLPALLHAYSHDKAPKHFEHTLYVTCVSPLNKKFMQHLTGIVRNANPVRANAITNESSRPPSEDPLYSGESSESFISP